MFLRVFRSEDFCMFQIGRSDVIKHKMLFFWNLRTTASKAPVLRYLDIYWGSCSIKQLGLKFYRKKTPPQVFSCEFWEILQNLILKSPYERLPLEVFTYVKKGDIDLEVIFNHFYRRFQ